MDRHAIDDTVDLESLPYFDDHYGVRDDVKNRIPANSAGTGAPPKITVMAHVQSAEFIFLRFKQRRHWMVVSASVMLQSLTMIDHKHLEHKKGSFLLRPSCFVSGSD